MKRSELKNEIETGLRITPDNWGETYIISDEDAACEAMVSAFGEGTSQDYQNQLDEVETKIDHSIFELNGKFYAVQEPYHYNSGYGSMKPATDLMYIECDDPKTVTDGLVAVHGKWQSFDDEEPDMTHEETKTIRKKVVEHEGFCQVCGSAAEYAILGKGDTLYRDIGSAICICKRCLTQDADMAWDKMETI